MIERMKVVSSNIEWLEYSDETKTLKVGFKKSGIYRFDGVPEDVANGFAVPDTSIGRYFSANIKGRYPFERLPKAELV